MITQCSYKKLPKYHHFINMADINDSILQALYYLILSCYHLTNFTEGLTFWDTFTNMKHILIYEIGGDKVNKTNCIKAKLHDLYSPFNITGMSKSLMMKWVGHKAYMVKKTNKGYVSVILVTKPPRERPLQEL